MKRILLAVLFLLSGSLCSAGFYDDLAGGRAAMEKEDYKAALDFLLRAEKTAPENTRMSLYIDNGISYRALKNYDMAIKYYKQAAELSPKMPDLYCNIGLAYYYKGAFKKSVEYFNRTMRSLQIPEDVAAKVRPELFKEE